MKQSIILVILACWSLQSAHGYLELNQSNRTKICMMTSDSMSCTYRFIDSVNVDALAGLEQSLIDLSLAYNKIQFLNGKMWQKVTNLFKIDLTSNSLESFDFTQLVSMSNLFIVTLSRNNIIDLKPFVSMPSLRQLDLDYNRISVLKPDQFKGLENLRSLKLGNNHITVLNPTTFKSLTSLVTLDLTSNKLLSLDVSLFQSLTQLQELKLGSNMLYQIAPNTFAPLPNLYNLDLSSNQIDTLATGVISKNLRVSLDSLSLRSNGLAYITIVDIYCLSLDNIDLCYNNITSVSSSDCATFRNIKTAWTKNQGITPRSCLN